MGMHDGHREKLRRRFAEGGAGQFTDCELLELLLFYAIPPAGHQRPGPPAAGAVRLFTGSA